MASYIIRIFKSWGVADPERRWVNSYEITSGELTSPEAHLPTLAALVLAEQAIHLHKVHFLSATVSTWLPDSHPYDPTAFVTAELAVQGLRDVPDTHALEALDSNVALLVKRVCTTGRSGKLFYRGCLLELDVEMGGDGRFRISTGAAIANDGAAMLAYKSAMEPFLGAAEGETALALISQPGGVTSIRPVADLVASGVTINRRNHRYFDRGGA